MLQHVACEKAQVDAYFGGFLGITGGVAVSGSNGPIANGSSADFVVHGPRLVVAAGSHRAAISTPAGVYQIVEVGMSIRSGLVDYDPKFVAAFYRQIQQNRRPCLITL